MKSKNNGFTFVDLIGALFICSLIFAFLIPNLVRQYSNLSKMEKQLEMKELLYEEISNHNKEKNFSSHRREYNIVVDGRKAEVVDENTGERISYE